MRNFIQFAQETGPRFPMRTELYTWYHLEKYPYPPCKSDWGMCLAYHFDQGIRVASWLRLVECVRNWVKSQAGLRELVTFVPLYEIGEDFVAQCKPPFDGGYSTAMYGEFLDVGSCEPASWFYHQLATLHEEIQKSRGELGRNGTAGLLRRIIHATFIKPSDHLFRADTQGWSVYLPSITAEDVREWENVADR